MKRLHGVFYEVMTGVSRIPANRYALEYIASHHLKEACFVNVAVSF
jgi:hypothetical protein